jgi:hypothetical protein
MVTRIPFVDPSLDRQSDYGVPKLPEPFAITLKASFQWPPDFVGRFGHISTLWGWGCGTNYRRRCGNTCVGVD